MLSASADAIQEYSKSRLWSNARKDVRRIKIYNINLYASKLKVIVFKPLDKDEP